MARSGVEGDLQSIAFDDDLKGRPRASAANIERRRRGNDVLRGGQC